MSSTTTSPAAHQPPLIEDVSESLGMWGVLFAGLDPHDQAWVLECLDRHRDTALTARL